MLYNMSFFLHFTVGLYGDSGLLPARNLLKKGKCVNKKSQLQCLMGSGSDLHVVIMFDDVDFVSGSVP